MRAAHIFWMIRRHMPQVVPIENRSFEHPWSEEDFMASLRQQNCMGMVAQYDERIVGYLVYQIYPKGFHITNFAVHPDFRRQGIATQLLNEMKRKLEGSKKPEEYRRYHLTLEVSEKNLEAQLFFRDMGFRAIRVLRDFFKKPQETAYFMRHSIMREPGNRLTEYFKSLV